MGKKDIISKKYMKDTVRFADLVNGSLFQGEEVIKPENLELGDIEANEYFVDKEGKCVPVAKFRDVVMQTDFAIFTEENQAKIQYAMPVKNMVYDSLNYANQVNEFRKEHLRNKENMSSGEYLSGMKKEDKLIPVVNVVIYYGEEEWDASLDLHGMMKFGPTDSVGNIIRKLVPNYEINLIDVSRINNTKIYKSDLQVIFEMLKYRNDKEGMKEYIDSNRDKLEEADEDALDMLGVLLGEEKRFYSIRRKKGEGKTMCKAIDDWIKEIEDGVNEKNKEEML